MEAGGDGDVDIVEKEVPSAVFGSAKEVKGGFANIFFWLGGEGIGGMRLSTLCALRLRCVNLVALIIYNFEGG